MPVTNEELDATTDQAPNTAANWIHLDLKGVVPGEARLLEWLNWFTHAGFNGVVWEYEDRFDWQSWPGTFRGGYSRDQWERIWQRCAHLQLEVVPLVQTLGHLQWLLKYEPYAAWRENGHLDEVCPQHPDVLPALTAWLDEVIALHPGSTFINV